MKKIFYFVVSLLFCNVFSQNPLQNSPIYGGEQVIIDVNSNIKGNDFIYDEWNKGVLVLNDSVFSKQDAIRYNAYKDRVLIKLKAAVIEIDDKSLTGFSIIENKRNLKHDFVKLKNINFISGYSDSASGYYEIIFNVENLNYFIKKNKKEIFDPNRSKGSQTINNYPLEYKDITEYFIKNKEGLYVKVRLKRKDISAFLSQNKHLVNNYIKLKKIKFNKESDVVKLINYYYSI
jgi:hypothetical protein